MKTLEKTIYVPRVISVKYEVFDGKTIPEYEKGFWDNVFIQDEVLVMESVSYHNGDVSETRVKKGQVVTSSGQVYNSEVEFLLDWIAK